MLMQYLFFHGQWEEDFIIRSRVPLPEFGFYVDVGSGHYQRLSNTYHFDKNGWQGICIEANPERLKEYPAHRSAILENVAIGPSGVLRIGNNPDFSTAANHLEENEICKEITVPCCSLESILVKHNVGHIDLLTIDIEGHEEWAFRSMDQNRKPTVVIIEHETHGRENNKKNIFQMMDEAGYKVLTETYSNLIFVR